MPAQIGLWDAALELPAYVLPLGALPACLPRSAAGAPLLRKLLRGDALLGIAARGEHACARANDDCGGGGQTSAVPNEKAPPGVQVPAPEQRSTSQT